MNKLVNEFKNKLEALGYDQQGGGVSNEIAGEDNEWFSSITKRWYKIIQTIKAGLWTRSGIYGSLGF